MPWVCDVVAHTHGGPGSTGPRTFREAKLYQLTAPVLANPGPGITRRRHDTTTAGRASPGPPAGATGHDQPATRSPAVWIEVNPTPSNYVGNDVNVK